MEDFLKDRPVLDPKSTLVLAAEPKPAVAAVKPPAGSAPAASEGPFGSLRREPATQAAAGKPTARPSGGAPGAPADPSSGAPAQPQSLKGEHGTKVQTIVERGRVVKIIVTCTCGKVTEIACQY
ncbi:MAG: hypothetical protein IAE82_16510 [Opitutaceae bacterium]|nr:hypothetical protein [Opitutaceae bacterium]